AIIPSIRLSETTLVSFLWGCCGWHIEMTDQDDKVLQTLSKPDRIQAGDSGERLAIRHYDKTPVTTDKFLVVAYRETSPNDGFVITAYFTRRFSNRRETLWKSPNS
ncbi:MAG: hypothetical protein AAFV90_28560, partial [Cyanobacteria bacterium J06634_5]